VSQPATSVESTGPDLLQAGRAAFARRSWQEAFDLLTQADAASPLSGADLESLADAAFFAARPDARIAVKERAVKAYQEAGEPVRAAFVALGVAGEHGMRGRGSIASAWTRRAERLLDGQPEGYAHAALAIARSQLAKDGGDIEAAIRHGTDAVAIASRTGDPDVQAQALTLLAMLKIATGATGEGFGLLEEAAIAAVNGELSPITAGITSCQMISACRDLTDYQRASEWIDATDRWCERQAVSGFPGICRVHRAEIVALHGGWERAEQELKQATQELLAFEAIPPMADGLYAIGDIRRVRGDFDGAEEVLRQAHQFGRSPQPALALIRLGAGNVKAAAAAIAGALAEPNWDQWARARLLAAQVEIAVAAGDVALARSAADELTTIVSDYRSPALEAGRQQALGRVLLAEGDGSGALRELRQAIRSWTEVKAPYEVARTRAVLSKALRAVGDEDGADLELAAARSEFERLGAKPDLAAVDREIREIAERRGQLIQVRRTFLFTDIVGSTNLAEAMGNDAWGRLLRWHDDTLRALFARSGGRIVNSTGDGFFVAFDSAPEAIACAIAIQRALAEHRSSSGFAPAVRIGIHAADATQRGDDFSGLGVHVAARVAALAEGGQILISEDALTEAPDVAAPDVREVGIRGVSAPLRVATVSW
jgi:class 3 adenylate cyclase